MKYVTSLGDRDYIVEIIDDHHVVVDGKMYEVDFDSIADQPVYSLLVNHHSYEAYIYPVEPDWKVLLLGQLFSAAVVDEREQRLRRQGESSRVEDIEFVLKSPMPGLIISVTVSEGQQVEKGDVLMVLESMKMQNELKSPRPGTVNRVRVKAGDSVEQRQTLLSVA